MVKREKTTMKLQCNYFHEIHQQVCLAASIPDTKFSIKVQELVNAIQELMVEDSQHCLLMQSFVEECAATESD